MHHYRLPWVWVARFGHRRGYGVHSPSAYSFIRDVVLEPWPYYAYGSLAQRHSWLQRHVLTHPVDCCRLLFRVANYVHPSAYHLVGLGELERAYVDAAVPGAREAGSGAAALVVVGVSEIERAPQLLSRLDEGGAMVVEGICRNSGNRELWRTLQSDDRCGTSFDLYDYGIILRNNPRTRQHYIVNF